MDINKMSFLVLAGGKSSRMETQKADLDFEGKTFLETLIGKARDLGFGEIIVSGYPCREADIIFVPDELEQRGPLGGMYSGFKAAKNELCFVVSVDAPHLENGTVAAMINFHKTHKKPITLLCQNSKIQPLIGIYPTRVYKEILELIEQKPAPVFRFLDRFEYALFEPDEPGNSLLNINTPEDYKRYIKQKKSKA